MCAVRTRALGGGSRGRAADLLAVLGSHRAAGAAVGPGGHSDGVAMVFTVQDAGRRLSTRREALTAERARMVAAHTTELARIDAQLSAIDRVQGALAQVDQATTVERLLGALEQAGLKVMVTE